MLVHIKQIIDNANKKGYAVGAFNTFNLEITNAIAVGANKVNGSIIIQVSETTLKYAGAKVIANIVRTIAKNKFKHIPIALHLDHGKKFSSVIECIEAGFSSIMIDASESSFSENINITKKATEYAHKHNAWAQGELGMIVKDKQDINEMISNPSKFLTDPDQAQEFVAKTKIDTLAIAVGNIHGLYKIKHKAPKLYLDRLADISKQVKIPLVLHGASKIPDHDIKKAISLGVRVINIDTEIRYAFRTSLIESLKVKDQYDPRKILTPVIDEISDVVANKILVFKNDKKL
ncbi:class II fructose-bisphosphate aldolase [Patescibacteria group bacterium]|nr:class II fructose-bisphosphate aldolase [Patescibacteria group bacterium]